MKLPFHKMVGAGNDFVFVREEHIPETADPAKLTAFLCGRQEGIGADGLAVFGVVDLEQRRFRWDFYNSDGSSAEMCGNAARCAVVYLAEVFDITDCTVETQAGPVSGKIIDGGASVSWELRSNQMKSCTVDLENFKSFQGYFMDTGVPHFVIFNTSVEATEQDCLEIQKHPQFGAAQTNVTFLETVDGKNQTKTFERGVRTFTLACGTGVIASALVLENEEPQDLYQLVAPGGKLQVIIKQKSVTLIGPARSTFAGTFILKEGNYV